MTQATALQIEAIKGQLIALYEVRLQALEKINKLEKLKHELEK